MRFEIYPVQPEALFISVDQFDRAQVRILADLANAYLLNGDAATALTTVDEAIQVATERHARIPECLACIVRADVLLLSADSEQRAERRQQLETARALMRETGDMLFENFISTRDLGQSSPRKYRRKIAEQMRGRKRLSGPLGLRIDT